MRPRRVSACLILLLAAFGAWEAEARAPITLIPHGGLAFGTHNFPDQTRAGIDVRYPVWPTADLGLNLETGFRHGRLFSATPTFVHIVGWPRIGALRTAVYGGFPLVYYSQAGTSDLLYGVSAGVELHYPLARVGRGNLDLVARGGAEILLFGTSKTAIPVIVSLGMAVRL
ncbi:MAG: hypothetical protein V1495_06530 [Pseudomonadota bacterium]